MQFAQRQSLFPNRQRSLLAGIPVGLLLGFAGPFGTLPAFPTATRYAFWLGLSVVGAIAVMVSDAALPLKRPRGAALRITAVAMASAVPMTFIVAWIMSLIQPGRAYRPLELFALFWGVAVIQLLIAAVLFLASGRSASDDPVRPGQMDPALDVEEGMVAFPTAFLSKLPMGIGRDIRALETEDHYLRVHAAGGNALVLMRMADAVAMLDPRLGMQVHRRWWVTAKAVSEVRTEGQKLLLQLVDGRTVPVGRTFATVVRARFATSPSGQVELAKGSE